MPFILWQLYFPTVFKENGGFDIIIGNPPYGAKISADDKKIADYADEDGEPFYYRVAGSEYFNVVTPYATGSSQEIPYPVRKIFKNVISATLSTSLFWFYQHVYCDGLHIKQTELETFPLFDLEKLTPAQIERIEKIYDEYLRDIERNVSVRTSSANSSYNVAQSKNYKLNKSKALIDKLDDVIGKFYGLSNAEINFIKNFELEFRMSGADCD